MNLNFRPLEWITARNDVPRAAAPAGLRRRELARLALPIVALLLAAAHQHMETAACIPERVHRPSGSAKAATVEVPTEWNSLLQPNDGLGQS